MVLIHVKGKSDIDQFLFEAAGTRSLDEITSEITEAWNLRLKLKWYVVCAKDLAQRSITAASTSTSTPSGSSASAEEDGTTTASSSSSSSSGTAAPAPFEQLKRTAEEAEAYISAKRASQDRGLCDLETLQRHVELLRAAVKMYYPAEATTPIEKLSKDLASLDIDEDTRLKKQHIIHVMSDDPEMADMKELLEPKTSQLWFAGKPMYRDKPLNAFTGKNEKTKIVCKLTSAGTGAPAREPALDERTQREMMAFWYKKQEEDKALAADDADLSFANSKWADPKALKSTFQGLKSEIRFK